MENLVDLSELRHILGRHGERVVVVVPGQTPIVLLSLAEYEQLSQGRASGMSQKNTRPQAIESKPQPKNSAFQPPKLETIDPQQGALEDDDQYYPEPL